MRPCVPRASVPSPGLLLLLLGGALVCPRAAGAQVPVTLDDAVRTALAVAPRMARARSDSAVSSSGVRVAREYPNPALALGYSESPPRYHFELEQELEYPWVRGPRIQAARASLEASSLRVGIEGARVRYDVVAIYAEAVAARRIAALSAGQAAGGDELVRLARARRDAGDASELDVELAQVSAAQLHATFLSDSLHMTSATLELQSAMGLPLDSVRILPVDTIAVFPPEASRGVMAVAAGEAERQAAERLLLGRRRGRLPAPILRAGFERGDPTGSEPGTLPTAGLSIPLPLFHRQGGAVAEARARVEGAAASLAEARREAELALALARRTRDVARARLEGDREALDLARAVSDRSLAAYREGAYSLASVLESRRSAGEAERRVLEDSALFRTAEAALVLARTAGVRP